MNQTISSRHAERARERNFWAKHPDLLKSLGIPAVLAILGFILGIAANELKDRSAADRATKDIRSKALIATASAFSGYAVNWSRLRTVSEAETEIDNQLAEARKKSKSTKPESDPLVTRLQSTLAVVKARKEKYVAGRDAAKDDLMRQLEIAKIFFSAEILPSIAAFEQFDASASILGLKDLPPRESWRNRFAPILRQMQEEVKRDES